VRILVTNDDGIGAQGLRALVEAASEHGEVRVVAPDRERSACGHSMTMRDPLRVSQVEWAGVVAYAVSGLPVDCVNVALEIAWKGGCDAVLSGINAGPNLGFDITYSGTVGAAMEAAINGIRGVSVSMASFVSGAPFHFHTGKRWLAENLGSLLSAPLPDLTFLNVNIPNVEYVELRGTRVVPIGRRIYEERIEYRDDPWGRPYYWQGGVQVLTANQPGTDVGAVSDQFVSVSPITVDWTAHAVLDSLTTALT
jgi:5'-nucleotidase